MAEKLDPSTPYLGQQMSLISIGNDRDITKKHSTPAHHSPSLPQSALLDLPHAPTTFLHLLRPVQGSRLWV